ncbi:MAG: hypothetical protein CML66_25995 [Rhodobacteraceae bacterium]|nr:hypothetical protein [Paracoccaceae bacterium]MAY43892.1 hypothetical protein [Paracoccaceae bacterium]|tara:strand:- start:2039 stop:2362 length:324 start_codon:yes stop_codon:yes gene_type:complete
MAKAWNRIVYNLANSSSINDDERFSKVQAINDVDLYAALLMDRRTNTDEWDAAIALAKTELARRERKETEELLMRTTNRAAWTGIVGACLGGALGAGATVLVFLLSK